MGNLKKKRKSNAGFKNYKRNQPFFSSTKAGKYSFTGRQNRRHRYVKPSQAIFKRKISKAGKCICRASSQAR